MQRRLICLDTETTGFSREHDRIIEIGCVDITNGWEERKLFQRYINPQRSVPESAIKIHGLTETFLQQYQPFDAHIQDFFDFIGDSILIIHNAIFDINFLNAEMSRYNEKNIENEVIDTLKLAKVRFPGKKINLNALKSYFNINIERQYHGALLDSEILAQVYLQMQTTQISFDMNGSEPTEKANEPSKRLFKL
jgi:DNA polymerase-3 subunit epsilon